MTPLDETAEYRPSDGEWGRIPSQLDRHLHPAYTEYVEHDYVSQSPYRGAKARSRQLAYATNEHDMALVELALEGVPVAAITLSTVGVLWLINTIVSQNTAYAFSSFCMFVGFLLLYAVSQNAKRRYRRMRSAQKRSAAVIRVAQ